MKTGNTLLLGQNDDGRRLDRILRKAFGDIPLSAIHMALRKGKIRVNGIIRPPEYLCKAGEIVEYFLRLAPEPPSPPSRDGFGSPAAPSLELSLILLETPDLLFLDKPAGLLVHDGDNSLEAMVRRYLSGKLDASQSFAPGPLHRLDRNTSGVIAFSRSISGARVFSEALRQGLASKTYIALLEGQAGEPELWNDLVVRDGTTRKSRVEGREELHEPTSGAKEAIAEMVPLLANDHATLALIRLLTGRTHQIRSQAAAHGHPLLGDRKYGSPSKELRYYLHAWKLSFRTRLFDELPPEIIAPLPRYFIEKAQSIFSIDEKGVYSKLRHF